MKNARGLKKGDLIKCTDGREVARMIKILGDEGYHAVRVWPNWIRVTSLPERREKEECGMT